jgi:hypothetical protein
MPQGGLAAGEGDRGRLGLIHDLVDDLLHLPGGHLLHLAPAVRRAGIAEGAAVVAAIGERDLREHRQLDGVAAEGHAPHRRAPPGLIAQQTLHAFQ